jgi:hypothetical protein
MQIEILCLLCSQHSLALDTLEGTLREEKPEGKGYGKVADYLAYQTTESMLLMFEFGKVRREVERRIAEAM